MQIYTTYSVKIKHYNYIFKDTVSVYRKAVDFFIDVCLKEWNDIKIIEGQTYRQSYIETLTHVTKEHSAPRYDFDRKFYKFPSFLRRAAINEAQGKVSTYMKKSVSDYLKQGLPKAGFAFPVLYKGNMFVRTGTYTASIKVWIRNTWDWLDIVLDRGDVNYNENHCKSRSQCAPVLCKRGKQWFLDFSFEEKLELGDVPVRERRILAADLGINNACTCCVMNADGTIIGRHFFRTPVETDQLHHRINRIKKAQQHGAGRTPRLWASANGMNDRIAVRTAEFIIKTAILYNVDVIVFEHLDLGTKKSGSRKQKLHLWKARYVQSMVTDRVHREHIRISHVNAWNTSRLAFDGSGPVKRGTYFQNRTEKYNYSICTFATGKQYHCDLNASYNIGARYYIREILKSLPVTSRLQLEAKVPQVCKRSTCTLSSLISLNAVLTA